MLLRANDSSHYWTALAGLAKEDLLSPYPEFLYLHTLPTRGQGHAAMSHIFLKDRIFLSLLLVPLLNVAATSVIHKEVNPPANRLCPGCRAMGDDAVWSCLQSSMT